MTATPLIRCAVYTRTSSDEGLDQAFNSLHAQRSASEAYILSQAGEGWTCLPQPYDDGGHSGATMDRPGLTRLLADIDAGRVDVVVVYKIDRLTRSLSDFARIVERLERASASFVSVTQSFNTTSSMGKLTLNILLSFAQFERDVTSERIRDKILASKSRGMWMGGLPPLGYRPAPNGERTLVIEPSEAETVRLIFRRLLELGSVIAVQRSLESEGLRSAIWNAQEQRRIDTCRWSRGALQHLLLNPVYAGLIRHKGTVYQGRHQAIIDRATFDAAHVIVARNQERLRTRVTKADRLLMTGLVFDSDGQVMKASFGQCRRLRYAYYVSRPIPGGVDAEGREDAIRRVPVNAVDAMVASLCGRILDRAPEALSRDDVRKLIRRMDVLPAAVHFTLRTAEMPGRMTSAEAMARLRSRLDPTTQVVADPSHTGLVRLLVPTRLVVRGGRSWLKGPDGKSIVPPGRPDRSSVKVLRLSHQALRATGADPTSIRPIRIVRMPKSPKQRAKLDLAFLAPDLQKAVLNGELRLPSDRSQPLPLSWAKQRELFARCDPSAANPRS